MNFKRITQIFPLLGAFLVLLGYLKLYIYYQHWNIPIIEYLGISEITLLFLSDVHIILAFIVIFMFPFVIGITIIKYVEERDAERRLRAAGDTVPSAEQISANISHDPFNGVKGGLSISCLIIAVIFISLFFCFNKIWLLYFATMSFMQFALIFSDFLFEPNDKLSIQVTFITTATAFSILVARYDICKTELNPDKLSITIITETGMNVTSNSLIYVGKTNNYVFLYDSLNKTSRTIKNEAVKEILIREN